MTKELKKKLYIMFGSLFLVLFIVPRIGNFIFYMIYNASMRQGFKFDFYSIRMALNLGCAVLYIIVLIIAIGWIKKYRVLRALKSSVVMAIGVLVVLILCGIDVISAISYGMDISIMMYIENYAFAIPKYIAMYITIVGIVGILKIKETESKSVSTNESVTLKNDSLQGGNDDLRKAIYDKYCEEVKKSLKSPASAVFCNIDELSITDNYGVYAVNGWVDSQNSYGAMIRTNVKLNMIMENGQLVSKTNLAISASGKVAKNLVAYYIIGAILTLISFGFFYFIISGML